MILAILVTLVFFAPIAMSVLDTTSFGVLLITSAIPPLCPANDAANVS